MKDSSKTKGQLVKELTELRRKLSELEKVDSERKRAEDALKDERERLYAILDSFPGFVCFQAPDYTIRFANKRFKEEYGEPGNRPCHEVMWGRREPCEKCLTFSVFDTKKPVRWISDHASTGRVYEVYDYPYVENDGSLLVLEIGVDITDHKRAEKSLRESEERHRVLFEDSRDAIMILAPPSWNFTSGNPTSIEMFGARDERDFCSRPPWKYSPDFQPDGRPSDDKAREMLQAAMREGSNYFEWIYRRTDGEEFPATVLLSRVEISGQVLLQATVRDISKRRTAEEQLLNKSRELETLTEDLRKLSSMLSKEDELSRKKLAAILHEQIGQNLAVFSMNFDDIAEGAITGEANIKNTISNLAAILEDTIKSTRELTADLYPTILDDLGFLPAVTWHKELVLDPLKIEVLMDIDKSVEGLSSDYKLSLFRILQEAILNISKHSRATEVAVIYTMQSDTGKLYVKDNGVGFDLKELKSRKDKGLGLMLLKERSLALGGNITIESALGKGTELTVGLPLHK